MNQHRKAYNNNEHIYSHTVKGFFIFYNKKGVTIQDSKTSEMLPNVFDNTEDAEKYIKIFL